MKKMKKMASVSYDFGDGVRATVTDNTAEQQELEEGFELGMALTGVVFENAMNHLDEFTEEQQELIKVVWESLDECLDE